MEEIRCSHCNRKLAEAEYTRLNIKCPRCGAYNHLRASEHPPARPGASPLGDARAEKIPW